MSSSPQKAAMLADTDASNYTVPLNSEKPTAPESLYLDISLAAQYLTSQPVTLIMRGEYRSPDFEILAPDGSTLFTVHTDSTWAFHEMDIHDARIPRRLFTVKRKGHSDNEDWFYSADEPKKEGKKLLEISTSPRLISKGGSVRLVFRNDRDGELDALHFQVDPNSSHMQVIHQGRQVDSIQWDDKAKVPKFQLNVPGGIDPVLMVIMALVVDDRLMTKRRRVRRPLGSGFAGIWKWPGAGLAGAYTLGGAI